MLSSVDLPQPDVPTSDTNPPVGTSRSKPSRAATRPAPDPNTFTTPRISSLAGRWS